jgi:hypothetical protein
MSKRLRKIFFEDTVFPGQERNNKKKNQNRFILNALSDICFWRQNHSCGR